MTPHKQRAKMMPNLQNDYMMSPPHDKVSTNEEHQPEPRCVPNGQLNDHPTENQMTQDYQQVPPEASHDSLISNDSNVKNEARHCNDQTSSLPNEFFSISRYLNNQRADEWIDDLDAHGGRLVRAIISSATPAVWMQALSGRAHFVDRTYLMEQAMIKRRSDNPKTGSVPKRSRVRRAARQRAKSKERGD
jgi:hypothetical protein